MGIGQLVQQDGVSSVFVRALTHTAGKTVFAPGLTKVGKKMSLAAIGRDAFEL
jgi:hypothetical protein